MLPTRKMETGGDFLYINGEREKCQITELITGIWYVDTVETQNSNVKFVSTRTLGTCTCTLYGTPIFEFS